MPLLLCQANRTSHQELHAVAPWKAPAQLHSHGPTDTVPLPSPLHQRGLASDSSRHKPWLHAIKLAAQELQPPPRNAARAWWHPGSWCHHKQVARPGRKDGPEQDLVATQHSAKLSKAAGTASQVRLSQLCRMHCRAGRSVGPQPLYALIFCPPPPPKHDRGSSPKPLELASAVPPGQARGWQLGAAP